MPGRHHDIAEKLKAALPAVILPTLAAVTLLALVIGLLLHYSTSRSDALAIARQNQLVTVAAEQSALKVATDQEASTLWDDAVLRVHERPLDNGWLDNNLGIWFHTYYDHDEVYLLDPTDRPIYAMQAGVRTRPATFARVSREVLQLAGPLRRQLRSGYVAPAGSRSQTIGALDRAIVAGRPAIVSVKPIVSETGDIAQASGSEYLHVSVRYLDGSFLKQLSSDFGIAGAQFSWAPGKQASLPIKNQHGAIIGYFVWPPFEPGEQIESQMVPVLWGALLLIGALLGALLWRVWRSRLELEASRAQAQHLAFHDPLTGLPNRALFDDRLRRSLARRRAGLAVVLLDLDRFKNVNDTLGHQAGDALIREFGARLVNLLRDGDTVARLGGDEFALIIEDTDERKVGALCERILHAVRLPFEVLGSQAFVGVSAGVALAPMPGDDAAELVRKADIALYRAKDEGRDCHRVFTAIMDASVRLRGTIEHQLRHALSSGEGLRVHYQPEVSGPSGEIVGLEALVRWEHPTRGLISPEQFVPVAEEAGLIVPLGEWVLTEAARTSARWPDMFVAVNLSPVQFRSPGMVERFLSIIKAAGADPANIQLEVTERVLLDDDDTVKVALGRLRSAGLRIALDDFGTGYSSLSYLRKFEIDKIKIDQSFVRYLGVAGDSSAIVLAVLALGRAMGLDVTAEGVETSDQQRFLANAGCKEMQGFLFSKAVPEAELALLLGSGGATKVA